MTPGRSRERIAKNFVHRYGEDKLRRLLELLSSGESGERIAAEFEVSRERVRQWKNAFGQVVTLYQVFPEVSGVLVEKPPASKR
jgi:hypothetical protein